MTNKEAIRTLEANYPDACFELLREAVDAAVEALKAQDAVEDTISRQAAINTVHRMREIWDTGDIDDLEEMIVTALAELCPVKRTEERTETHACDCIDRQALCEYALNQKDKNVTPNDIMRFPPAKTEIIRCKECKHQVKEWRTDKRLKDNGYMVCGCDVVGDACGYWALLGQDDDYCSMAERKCNG